MLTLHRSVARVSIRIQRVDALTASVSNKIVYLPPSPHKHKLSSLLMPSTPVCATWELELMADHVRCTHKEHNFMVLMVNLLVLFQLNKALLTSILHPLPPVPSAHMVMIAVHLLRIPTLIRRNNLASGLSRILILLSSHLQSLVSHTHVPRVAIADKLLKMISVSHLSPQPVVRNLRPITLLVPLLHPHRISNHLNHPNLL